MSRPRRRHLLLGYLVLLVLSGLYRRHFVTSEPDPDLPWVEVESHGAVGQEERTTQKVRIAYREWGATSDRSPVVVLLHGSPGSSTDFRALAPQLPPRFRVLAPDFPGFGASTRRVADYSIRSHAAMTREWLDALGVGPVHLLGFSMGGGVALEMLDQDPGRVRSLTLLSSIGVQEQELLGDYSMNHAVHGLQLAGLWLLREATPNFGAFDHSMLNVEYARNFFDSDQRPLRRILENVEVPTLIVHGTRDPLVPVTAAEEHHRLVPQSELVRFDASHFMVFRAPADLVDVLSRFLTLADDGQAPVRKQATSERLRGAQMPYDPTSLQPVEGLALWVLGLLLALSTLASEDLTCIGAGLLVSHGRLEFLPAVVACGLGILVGDLALYGAGRFLGRGGLHRRPWRWLLSPERVESSTRWFAERGPWVILGSRFVPGARLPTYFAAGLLRAGFWRFLGWFVLAVALWTPLLVGLSVLLGTVMLDYFEIFRRYALLGILTVVALAYLMAKILPELSTHSGRRRLLGAWRRLSRWEFWPRWAFYPPVVLWVLALGLRYRCFTLFSAANPGIPDGGFVGESKADILDQLDPASVAPYRRLRAVDSQKERLAKVEDFRRERPGEPVVLKPDVGQRGEGVAIAREAADGVAFLERTRGEAMVQEYVPGVELGVFYVRHPDDERGSTFSVTDKRMPFVVGDGRRSLEELVLDDERAVCLATLYLERLGSRRFEIPQVGERVPLAELGTHCLGAVFLDGERYATPQLEATVERLAQSFDGFYFGRFDLRAPSYEDFEAGRDIRVIELNGVTSEATHIYDPGSSLWSAYRTLFRQWRLAFEIGWACRERGHAPTPLRALLRTLFAQP
ncbi:MAG: alpha/beta fold hydrolase [Thermoanaerobaculia bacterium]|nr:alpha/beta fold hydrolase [Thermoanaerobaculia bacterium]